MGIFSKRHSRLTGDDLHSIVWQEVADTAGRLNVVADSNDVGKIVHQLDADTYWIVKSTGPLTYVELTGGGGGGGAVSSVFTRTGDVVAVSGDYSASEVSNDSGVSGVTVDLALDALESSKAATSHLHTSGDINDFPTALTFGVGVYSHAGWALETVSQGQWSTNNPTPSAVTSLKVYISGDFNTGGQSFWESVGLNDRLFFAVPTSQEVGGEPVTHVFRVTGSPSVSLGEVTIPVTWETGNGSVYSTSAYGISFARAPGGGGGGVSDHGLLEALSLLDDDHPQYHNDTRGDLRYYTQGQVDTALAGKAATAHTHAAADVTTGTFDNARISEANVTQHEAAIDHDALTNFAAAEHIDWSASGAEQIDASRYASGTGGATNTVSGTSPIENTGDNTNAVLALESQLESTFIGRASGAGSGVPNTLTATQARTVLNVEDGSTADGATGDAYAVSHTASTSAHAASQLNNDSGVSGTKVSDALDALAVLAPVSHATSHQNGGGDEISVSGLSGVLTDSQRVTIQEEGVPQGQASTVNYVGPEITANVVAGTATISVNVPQGDVIKSGASSATQVPVWSGTEAEIEATGVTIDGTDSVDVPGAVTVGTGISTAAGDIAATTGAVTAADHMEADEFRAVEQPTLTSTITGQGIFYANSSASGKPYFRSSAGINYDLTAPLDTLTLGDLNTKLIDGDVIDNRQNRWLADFGAAVTPATGDRVLIEDASDSFIKKWVDANDLGGVLDHGSLSGLGDDDHSIYSLADGTRAFTGPVEISGSSSALTVGEHATAPGTPAAAKVAIYAKADGKVYSKDDAGTEYDLTQGAAGGGPSTPGTTAVGQIAVFDSTDGSSLGDAMIKVGEYTAQTGTRTLGAQATMVGGVAGSSATLNATAAGSVVLAHAPLFGTAQTTTNAYGALVTGDMEGSGSLLEATDRGAVVHGSAESGGEISANGRGAMAVGRASGGELSASTFGALTFGYVNQASGTSSITNTGSGSIVVGNTLSLTGTATITAGGQGSCAHAYASQVTSGASTVSATANGSSVFGGAETGGTLTSSGFGSMAIGRANAGTISVSGESALQVGIGTNVEDNSIQVGNIGSGGVRLIGDGAAAASPQNGDIHVASGDVVVRTGGNNVNLSSPSPKGINVPNPVAETVWFFHTSKALTISTCRAIIQGGTSIPVTLASGTTFGTVVDTHVNAQSASNTTTGANLTVADATIAAGSNVWLTFGTPVGTQTMIGIQLEFA